MKICDYTTGELEHFRGQCNFTGDEIAFFDMRARNISIERCAEELNCSVSTASRIAKRVTEKMRRVTE